MIDSSDPLHDLPSLPQIVTQYKLGANKRLGQHFLLDKNLLDKIARLAAPLSGYHVAEIGPGPGGLTRALLQLGANQVLAIEKDSRFIPALAQIGDRASGRLEIIEGDALRINLAETLPEPRKIIANLPYNVGTKMLINWLSAKPCFWSQMVLMFQKEVAERITAQPGDKAYGRLAILCQSVARAHIAFDVPARLFTPPPKVDSAIVILEPHPQPFDDLQSLGQISAAAFGQRRKMLRKSLKPFAKARDIDLGLWLEQCAIDPQARPETLTITDFHTLTQQLKMLKHNQ